MARGRWRPRGEAPQISVSDREPEELEAEDGGEGAGETGLGREAEGAPRAEGEGPASSEARGKDVKMEGQRHGGGWTNGQGERVSWGWDHRQRQGTPPKKREASTLCGIFQSCHSPSTHLARNEHLLCPGRSAGPWGHEACYT